MSDDTGQTPSALQAFGSKVMSGEKRTDDQQIGAVDAAPGQARYDPADVISVFMSARESAKQRDAQARRTPPAPRRKSQPS